MKKYIIVSLFIIMLFLTSCQKTSDSSCYTAENLFKAKFNIVLPTNTEKIVFYWDEQRKGASGILEIDTEYTSELISKLEESIGKSEYEDLSKTVNGDYYNLFGKQEDIAYMHSFYIEGVKHHIVVVSGFAYFTLVYIVEG